MSTLCLFAGALAATRSVSPGTWGVTVHARQPLRVSRISALAESGKGDQGGDPPLPEGEDTAGSYSTDWDSAWKKFQEEGSAGWRPEGRSAYTTQELASARATRVINEMRSSVPSPNEVVRDSRFWFALLVALALAPSLYTAFQATSHSGDVLV